MYKIKVYVNIYSLKETGWERDKMEKNNNCNLSFLPNII